MKINNIGLKAEKPQGTCQSSKCPWHGNIKIRGRIFKGKVVSVRALKTAIVSWDYYNFIPKYERYERRKTRIAAHLPSCIHAKIGDIVRIGECRPLSKSKSFVVFEIIKDEKKGE